MAGELEFTMSLAALIVSIVVAVVYKRKLTKIERFVVMSSTQQMRPSLRSTMPMEGPEPIEEEIQQPVKRGRPKLQEQSSFDKTKVINLLQQLITEIEAA